LLVPVRKSLRYGGYTHLAGDGPGGLGVVDPVHAAHMVVGEHLSESHLHSEGVVPTRAFSVVAVAAAAVDLQNMVSVGERIDVFSASLASVAPARLPLPVIA